MGVKYFCDKCGEPAVCRLILEVTICPISDKPSSKFRAQGEFCEEHADALTKCAMFEEMKRVPL